MRERWLVPVDFSLDSLDAARLAARDAARAGGDLVLLHVLGSHSLVFPWSFPEEGAMVPTADDAKQGALAKLDALADELAHDNGGLDVELALTEGDPVSAVLREADAWHATRIAMGRVGCTPAGHHMGSVAERVARDANVPVVLVGGSRQALKRDMAAFAILAPG
jgi:nucleotide-binding universal stress UspA family protein